MMHTRHFTPEERAQLLHLLSTAGPVEILMAVGAYVAHHHPDWLSGDRYRAKLAALAGQLRDEPWGDERDRNSV